MKNGIPSDIYYKLLDWKDTNPVDWKYVSTHHYNVERLCDMNPEQLMELYNNRVKIP